MLERSSVRFTPKKIVSGPAPHARAFSERYEPVDCDFVDELEDFSVRRIPVILEHWNEKAELIQVSGIIKDVFTTPEKAEFVRLADGTLVRLDRICEVREKELPPPAPLS